MKFADCPVLLDFDGEQLEVNHQMFDELSLTWNSADPSQPVTWPTSDGFRMVWRDDALPELLALQGQRLEAIDVAEWNGADGDLATAVPDHGWRAASCPPSPARLRAPAEPGHRANAPGRGVGFAQQLARALE